MNLSKKRMNTENSRKNINERFWDDMYGEFTNIISQGTTYRTGATAVIYYGIKRIQEP